jgi:DNA mismatch repair protein MutS2
MPGLRIFPESSLLTTEFEKIRELLLLQCISPMGKELVMEMAFHTDQELISILLKRTAEMMQVVAGGLPFPSAGYTETTKELSLLRIENSALTEHQWMLISQMLHTVKEVYGFFKTRRDTFPSLFSVLSGSIYEPVILNEIENVLDAEGQVKSSASAELARIRRSLQRARADADRIYLQVIGKYRKQGWLTESEESSRNGRRVLAIFAEQKRTIRGVVHDTSATGKTAFIEPEETIGINNAIASLEQEERLEITRILRALSASLRKYVPLMLQYRHQLGIFDLNRAKATLALQMDAHIPQIANAPVIDLKTARHPLLLIHNKQQHKSTIPFDLLLSGENRILVISGPNAGGKTVCMKTAGLLQMMFQAGMPVSAAGDSSFGIFENLLVDIGDSQSIEYELSTYSSRLRHMRIFLERVDEKSLFLIDEFGTGTDPNLGGALAEAVLEELNNRKAYGIITTHYLNLKVLADRTPGIMNGSMEFDLKRLRPLYKLLTGNQGAATLFLLQKEAGYHSL